jgi:hypothetical protein
MQRPFVNFGALFVSALNFAFTASNAIELKFVDGIYSFVTKPIPVAPFIASVIVASVVATGNLSRIVDFAESYFTKSK